MAALFRVKAIYEYSSPHEDDLNFDAGQVIAVTEEEDADWYGGEYVDADGVKKEGIFPRNFVEKIEPTHPPRPARSRPKKEPEHDTAPPPPEPAAPAEPEPVPVQEPEPEPVAAPEPEPEPETPQPEEPIEKTQAPEPVAPAPVTSEQPVSAPVPPLTAPRASEPQEAVQKPTSPPPVSEKPTSNSFKDRIAAFNKPAAPPVAPFKPTGLSSGGGGSGFIKKPFVAPPPSRNAYVPPPQQAPVSKIYRRDEDPEIKEKEVENQEQAEKAGLVPENTAEVPEDADQPKPTTLKERIALLQQQQREQAQRHADSAAKKEKPKKPPKKQSEAVPAPAEHVSAAEEGEEEAGETPAQAPSIPPIPGRASIDESAPRQSIDEAGDVSLSREPPPPRRKSSSKGPALDPVHDGNDADMSGAGDTTEGQDDTTEREDNDEPTRHLPPIPGAAAPATDTTPKNATEDDQDEDRQGDEDEENEEEDEDEEDVDPEAKRKAELRARMAKMSGGMGFHGMFGVPMPGPGAVPPKKKAATPKSESAPAVEEAEEPSTSSYGAPPVPTMMAMPGMAASRQSEDSRRSQDEGSAPVSRAPPPPVPSRSAADEEEADEEDDDETTPALTPAPSAPSRPTPTSQPPPAPASRPAPPPVPTESRPPPPPPPGNVQSPTEGSASDDEFSGAAKERQGDSSVSEDTRPTKLPPPMPPMPGQAPELPIRSPPMSPVSTEAPPMSPTMTNKRSSRPPPPIPVTAPAPPPSSTRPPPPPPPGPGNLSRQSTADVRVPLVGIPARPPQAGEENESEAAEYEGDYDTDIASSVPHKDALKAHARDSSQEDGSVQSPTEPPHAVPPPVPGASAPRAVPPPIPSHAPAPPPEPRQSVDMPRAAPPPPPPHSYPASPSPAQEEYDPYNYTNPVVPQKTPRIEEEPSAAPERWGAAATPSGRGRPSMDAPRKSIGNSRRSMDLPHPAGDSSFIADDIDLAVQSGWWKQANQVPPALQSRRDIFYECDESTSTNQGSKTIVTREIWVLFQDYSQTILTVRYDPYDPADAELEQRHEPPPRALRQDQMEDFYEKFGRPISEMALTKKDTVVGDGTPQGLVLELLRPFKDALKPVGTRAYGALVYSNMGNASTQQNDVIRPGDIISIRNARFQGKHGPMHAKYSAEVGKPDHVAIVAEWDGTKKKVRAWEQGRESKKVKIESFKLDDLRSGEVKIWRVMPRSWVGWNSLA